SPDLHLRHCDCPADFRPNKNKTEVFVDLHMSSRVLNLLYETFKDNPNIRVGSLNVNSSAQTGTSITIAGTLLHTVDVYDTYRSDNTERRDSK
ncbi:hypothetical protein J6590_101843, partial [Homalodisca vitripennis]